MTRCQKLVRLGAGVLLLPLVLPLAAGEPTPAPVPLAPPVQPAAPTGPLAGWTRIVLRGEKFLVATAEASLTRWPAAAGAPALVRAHSQIKLLGTGVKEFRVIAQPGAAGTTRRWVEVEENGEARAIEPDGLGLMKRWDFRLPAGSGPLPAAGAWGKPTPRSAKAAWPAAAALGAATCGGPADPYTLLANAGCLVAAPRTKVFIATRDAVTEVLAVRAGRASETLTIDDLDAGTTRAVTLDLWQVDLLPADGGAGVFNLTGRNRLWIDAGSGALVRIEGNHRNVPGAIRLELAGAALRAWPRPPSVWPFAASPP